MSSKKVNQKIRELLDSESMGYEVIEHEAVYTSEQAVSARGTELKQGAKSLIWKVGDKFVNTIASAAKRIDEYKLQMILNVSSLKMATPKEVKEVTGCNIGGVPPFGNLFGLDVYVDRSLGENEIIAFNAGSNKISIKMKYVDWERVVKPIVEDFSK